MAIDIEEFRQDVYSIVASVPYGRVITYGQIAWLMGRPQNSRLVGRVMRDVSGELNLPCHRVVNSQGRIAPHWVEQKLLLEAEGVVFKGNGCVDMKRSQWNWSEEDVDG